MTEYKPEDYSKYRIQKAKETVTRLLPISKEFISKIEELINTNK